MKYIKTIAVFFVLISFNVFGANNWMDRCKERYDQINYLESFKRVTNDIANAILPWWLQSENKIALNKMRSLESKNGNFYEKKIENIEKSMNNTSWLNVRNYRILPVATVCSAFALGRYTYKKTQTMGARGGILTGLCAAAPLYGYQLLGYFSNK